MSSKVACHFVNVSVIFIKTLF